MPSDLNLKKSWNPKLLKNREKIWEKEHQIFEEYKRNQQYQAKLQENKEKDDLLSLVDKTKPPKKDTKTDWMYHSPVSSEADSSSKANQDILLGRTRIQEGAFNSNNAKNATSKLDKVLKTGDSSADRPEKTETAQLSKTDPLYAIKLQQLKRKELMEKQRKIDKYKKGQTERKGKHRHSSHHHHHHRHSDYKSSDRPK